MPLFELMLTYGCYGAFWNETCTPEANAIVLLSANQEFSYDVTRKVWAKLGSTRSKFRKKVVVKDGSAVVASGNTLTVFGGDDSYGQTSKEVFHLKSNDWIKLKPMRNARTGAAATIVSDDVMLVLGGEVYNESSQRDQRFSQELENLFRAESPRISWDLENPPDFFLDIDQSQFNASEASKPRKFVRSCEIFRNNRFEREFDLEINQRSYAAAHVVEGILYFIGGWSMPVNENEINESNVPSNTVDLFNFNSQTWRKGAPMIYARACFGSAVLGQQIYVLGGTSNNTAELLNASSGQWTALISNIPSGIQECKACCVKGQIYVSDDTKRSHLYRYNPATKKWANENQQVPTKGKLVSFLLEENATEASSVRPQAFD